jgi:predicted aldo/keto reductase-like oxidoreductase
MRLTRLGRTGLQVSRVGFGALQIATKMDYPRAERLLNVAVDAGINILDTARGYQDAEERIGRALSHRRGEVLIATKAGNSTRKGFWEALEGSLERMRTDHVDIYQFHGAGPGSEKYIFEGEAVMECMQAAREQGKIRFIGFSAHSLEASQDLMRTGAFDVVQYPISYVGSEAAERGLVAEAERMDIGFLGMKPFGGGRLGHARYCLGYVFEFPWVVPMIGFEAEAEVQEVVALVENGVALTEADREAMEAIKAELGQEFCRGCNYCHPCPEGVPILDVMFFEVYRKQSGDDYVAREEYRQQIEQVANCAECRECVARCPFGLDIPRIMRQMLQRHRDMMASRR